MAKKDIGIARPVLTKRCKNCRKIFCIPHPKNTEEYCEECRALERRQEHGSI